MVLLFAAVTSLGLATPHYFPVIGSFGSILAPLLNGFVVRATGGFVWAFALAAVAGLIGVLHWVFVVGPIQPIVWSRVEVEALPAET